MRFCNNCDFKLYIKLKSDESNTLVFYCRVCGNTDNLLESDNLCVSKTQVKKSEQTFSDIINNFTKFDPTLLRVRNILCPNINCDTNNEKKVEKEIIKIRYDDTNMKYIYLCCVCDNAWKTHQT